MCTALSGVSVALASNLLFWYNWYSGYIVVQHNKQTPVPKLTHSLILSIKKRIPFSSKKEVPFP